MKIGRSKDLFGGSIVFIALAITLSGIVLINRASSLENRILMLGAFLGCIILAIYFVYIVKDPKRCFPFIICSSWFVTVEPAPADVFAVLGFFALALNMLLYKESRLTISLTDIMFLVFLGANAHNLLNTYDLGYSYRFVSVTLYLVLFYFLVSKVTDSFGSIEKQLKLFLIPCLITSFALLLSYFSGVSGVSIGFMQKLWAEGPRARS